MNIYNLYFLYILLKILNFNMKMTEIWIDKIRIKAQLEGQFKGVCRLATSYFEPSQQ